MSEAWGYVLTPQSRRDLRRLDLSVRLRIFDALDLYVAERRGDVRKLRGKLDEWRLRVGQWRVRFRPDYTNRVLVKLCVLPRGRAYRD